MDHDEVDDAGLICTDGQEMNDIDQPEPHVAKDLELGNSMKSNFVSLFLPRMRKTSGNYRNLTDVRDTEDTASGSNNSLSNTHALKENTGLVEKDE